jgi:hypothetical protein
MTASPSGRIRPELLSCELALGMDATLESSEREIGQVRDILRTAVEGLIAEFGERAASQAVVALQFQDLSDQLLASAARRIEMVRLVLGKNVAAPITPIPAAALAGGPAEYF